MTGGAGLAGRPESDVSKNSARRVGPGIERGIRQLPPAAESCTKGVSISRPNS